MHPALLALTVSFLAQADSGKPLEIGRTYRVPSRILGEERVIDVSLPPGYGSDTSQRYPVLVVLDGEYEHVIAATIARFYAATAQVPALIVVGVRNTNRERDMTTPAATGFNLPPEVGNAGGGAERFLSFLGDELLPYIDRHYHTAPLRVLAGHSLGGLLAVYALGHRPEVFTGYIVLEPSTWWNNGRELEEAKGVLRRPAGRHARLIAVNMEPLGIDTTAWGGTKPLVREISVTGETHSSMAVTGIAAGLRTIFADFKPEEWRPGTRPIAMLERYDSLSARVGYAVLIPEDAFSVVARMSLDSRHFADAEKVLARWERAYGRSGEWSEFQTRLTTERVQPAPAGFIPLEFPARRPAAREAASFIGRWVTIAQPDTHEVVIRASSDTIVVHDRVQLQGPTWFEGDDPVIQITSDGTLEWGLPFFRGLAALVVLRGKIQPDGTLLVTREVRGWVPRSPGSDLVRVERLRRISSAP